MEQRRRAAGVLPTQVGELLLEARIGPRVAIRRLQAVERSHENLGGVASAKLTEVAQSVW